MQLLGLLCCCVFSLLVEGQGAGRRYNRMMRGLPRQMMHRNNPRAARMQQQIMMRSGRRAAVGGPGGQPRAAGGSPEADPSQLQSWRDLVGMQGGVHDVDDFISLLVTDGGRQVTENDIFSPYETEDGKRVITGGGIMATSDECSPRNMSVRLPLNFSDTQVAYYPECTMVQRCGGCTPTPFLSCEPLYKEKIVLKVLRARYLYPGALSMRWEGFSSVEVERHLSCRAVCNLDPSECRSYQRFNPYQCKCVCMYYDHCYNEKVWDSEHCRCRCPNEGPCCAEYGEEDDRACTSYFDNDFCECTLKTSIGFSPNASQAEIEEWLATRRNPDDPNNPQFTHFAPTTTTTTTTTTTLPHAPECQRPCPRNFIRISNGRGGCACLHRSLEGRRSRMHG